MPETNFLKKLSIEHYKGFFEEQLIEFGVPNRNKNGSGLTVITGPNNTGKTSVVESLLIGEQNKKFTDDDLNGGTPIIKFIQDDGNEVIYTNISGGSQIQKIGNRNIKIFPVFSRRYWNHESGGSYGTSVYDNSILSRKNIRSNDGQDLIAVLKDINADENKKRFFSSHLNFIFPNISQRTISTNYNGVDYVKYITTDSHSHTSSSLGDGVLSAFVICAILTMHGNDDILIIDEPELSLHPQAQKKLARLLSKEAKNRQIIVCTHSPYFINREDLNNGAKFIRLNKFNDEKCEIFSLNNEENYSITEGNIHYRQKPQLLDIAAKEIFFSEKILFVEGQEDVGLIKKYAHDNSIELNFDIFGYGAGGYTNIKLLVKMAHDLGLQKVGVLYDGDVLDSELENISAIDNGYKAIKLSTDDIRDKEAITIHHQDRDERKGEKIGVFDKDGHLKPGKEEYWEGIIREFIDYFND